MFYASVVQLARTFPCQGKGRRFESGHSLHCAGVVELVDTQDLKSCGHWPYRFKSDRRYQDI